MVKAFGRRPSQVARLGMGPAYGNRPSTNLRGTGATLWGFEESGVAGPRAELAGLGKDQVEWPGPAAKGLSLDNRIGRKELRLGQRRNERICKWE